MENSNRIDYGTFNRRTTSIGRIMKYRLTATGMAIILMTSCAMLTDLAMDAISPDKGGINTELVVGDKNQTLGTNQ